MNYAEHEIKNKHILIPDIPELDPQQCKIHETDSMAWSVLTIMLNGAVRPLRVVMTAQNTFSAVMRNALETRCQYCRETRDQI
jgi:hypothetical protein